MPGPKKEAHGLITEPGDMVVYCAGFPGNLRCQPLYFQDPTFAARPSPLIPSTWVLRSAFLPCSILKARTYSIIPTRIVWSPAAVSLRTAANGFPAGMDFSYPRGCSQCCFVVCL
jgi:hypothetical protein